MGRGYIQTVILQGTLAHNKRINLKVNRFGILLSVRGKEVEYKLYIRIFVSRRFFYPYVSTDNLGTVHDNPSLGNQAVKVYTNSQTTGSKQGLVTLVENFNAVDHDAVQPAHIDFSDSDLGVHDIGQGFGSLLAHIFLYGRYTSERYQDKIQHQQHPDDAVDDMFQYLDTRFHRLLSL